MTAAVDIAFLGLGSMGRPMAGRLIEAGHRVTVWNRTSASAEGLVRQGARAADSPAAAARGAELVVSMLADDAALDAVVFNDLGLLAGIESGAVHVSMSTISPACADRLTDAHDEQGSSYISAPVFGRPAAAERGELFVVAAGPSRPLQEAFAVFDAVGRRHFLVGDRPAQANVMKLAGNFMIMAATEAMGEAIAVAEAGGLDASTVVDVLTGTLFDTPIYRSYGAMIVERRFFPAGFTAKLGAKDMSLFAASAEAGGASTPFLAAVRERLRALIERHGEDVDWAAVGRMASASGEDPLTPGGAS